METKISEAILDYIDRVIESITNQTDYLGTIVNKNSNDSYSIRVNGITYLVPNGTDMEFSVGDTVWVHCPNGDKSRQFIMAKNVKRN